MWRSASPFPIGIPKPPATSHSNVNLKMKLYVTAVSTLVSTSDDLIISDLDEVHRRLRADDFWERGGSVPG